MKTLADVVAEVREAEAHGFDFSDAQGLKLARESVDRLAAASEWVRAEIDLGPTVANQADYDVPANVVRAKNVYIGTTPFTEVSYDELKGLEAGRLQPAEGGMNGGVFCERFSEDGTTKSITLFPAPEEGGQELVALASIEPGDNLELVSNLPFPGDKFRTVVNYAVGIAYATFDENMQAAATYLDKADGEAEGLRRRANSRMGRGPYKARVAGHVR